MIDSLSSSRTAETLNLPLQEFGDYNLQLAWAEDQGTRPAANFALCLADFLFSVRAEFSAKTSNGDEFDEPLLQDWKEIVSQNPQCSLVADFDHLSPSLGRWELQVESSSQGEKISLGISVSTEPRLFQDIEWLQSQRLDSSINPLIAVLRDNNRPFHSVFNTLVVLASRLGEIDSAELFGQNKERVASWTFSEPGPGAIPVFSYEGGALSIASVESDSSSSEPVCWLWPLIQVSTESQKVSAIPDEWRERLYATLKRTESTKHGELASLLDQLLKPPFQVSVVPLSEVPSVTYMTPPHDGVISVVASSSTGLIIGIDFDLQDQDILRALLHCYGHVLLGHIRQGDRYAHWDTLNTVNSDHGVRRWDREVRDCLSPWFEEPQERTVTALDECTALEKAQLGLWRSIGEMIGKSQQLHPLAEKYQRAAYQRRAAQRMIAMLEEFGGAMLCDGVGLGKTYVATTLMVHYANEWRNQHHDIALEEPFRITVLSPNSVASTWRREAIPSLASFGVPLSSVRVISHSKLSRITNSSEILQSTISKSVSDLEHLLLSDLVIVDEAHNFRSISAGRTKVLRDLLRIQPRLDIRRRVALLTATPINNTLDDLRQQASLMFSRPLWLSDARTPEGYRRQSRKEVEERCNKARKFKRTNTDVSALIIHGNLEGRFSDAIEFRDDLEFGPNVQRIGDYLKEEDKKLRLLQAEIRSTARESQSSDPPSGQTRIAEELLDRIVVQRSRALCKEIERQQSTDIELLFRPDQKIPEKLYYSDEYDGIQDVLARFLPLFDTQKISNFDVDPLTLKVYMWHDVRDGFKSATDSSAVVGLQRILVLKRLESSAVSFLITLLRLLVLHAHRLRQLRSLCEQVGDEDRRKVIQLDLAHLLSNCSDSDIEKIHLLSTGVDSSSPRQGFFKALSKSYVSVHSAADTDDPPPKQLSLFEDEEDDFPKRESLERLWALREPLVQDLATLMYVTPRLADIIFGRFEKSEWPHGFITGGVEDSDWPTSPTWGLRLVKDAKLRSLVRCLLLARRQDKKVIVFTQFSDTISYIQSVFRAATKFERDEWQIISQGLGLDNLKKTEVLELLQSVEAVTGSTEEKDEIVNSFSPYYRIGPHPPVTDDLNESEKDRLIEEWTGSWKFAILKPIQVLFSTDVLAEGVNLQDVSTMINFDVHWNPVRMIQRAGRIDRRLNPKVEKQSDFPDLISLAESLGRPLPRYYYHDHTDEAPITVNLILPDELETELQLRERIATKTLAIDFTLGLDQGTGAEADWMETYKYQGISSLNSIQRDRAIEQIASHHERLSKHFRKVGIKTEWSTNLNSWIREKGATDASPLIGRAMIGRRGGTLEVFSKYLEPVSVNNVPYWLWSEKKPGGSMFDGWLILDGRAENFPPKPTREIPLDERASAPVKAAHLLSAAEALARQVSLEALPSSIIGRPLQQGATALAAPKLGTEDDRRLVSIRDFFILQLSSFEEQNASEEGEEPIRVTPRRGISRQCTICGNVPGFHKCCSKCGETANSEDRIEELFGFRNIQSGKRESYEIPQPWCRKCRAASVRT